MDTPVYPWSSIFIYIELLPITQANMELRQNHQFDPFGPDAAAYDDPNFDMSNIDWNDPASFFNALGGGGPGGLPQR